MTTADPTAQPQAPPAPAPIVWDRNEKIFAALAALGVLFQQIRYYAHLPFLGYLLTRPVQYLIFDPATVAMVVAGAYARTGMENPVLVVVLALVSTAIVDPLRWLAGHRYGDRVLRLLINGGNKNAPPPKKDVVGRVERCVGKYGTWALVLGWFTPVPWLFIQLTAAASGMSLKKFMAADLFGTLLWVLAIEGLGYGVGQDAVDLVKSIAHYSTLVTIGVIVLAVVFGVFKASKQQRPAA